MTLLLRLLSVLTVVLLLASCRDRREEMDTGPSGTDVPTVIDVPPGTDAPIELPPGAEEALTTASFALGTAAAMAGPLTPQAEGLRDGAGRLDGPMREMRTRTDLEAGFSGMSVVEPPTCATFEWTALSVVITMTGCTLETTGEAISGTIMGAVTFFPTTVSLSFTALTVGSTTLDGSLLLNVGGNCSGMDLGCSACPDTDPLCPMRRETQQTLTGNLTVTSGGSTSLAITDMTVTPDPTGVTLSGELTIGTTAATVTNLHWNTGDCLPTSGTATLTASSTTITFLPTTPADGIVQVRVGMFPAFPQALFTPCAP